MNSKKLLKPQNNSAVLNEFITNKDEMLNKFDESKNRSVNKRLKVDKGIIAEASFREWLTQFLPKKYAVTSGYIVSQGGEFSKIRLHYDVIIYDAINAPILWVEKNPDSSEQGKIRAIPAEYVYCVLEIKSTLNLKSCKLAIQKLWELEPLLEKTDEINNPYKKYLPNNFCMGTVFFEVLEKDKNNIKILEELIPINLNKGGLRGYFGGIILSSEHIRNDKTGIISFTTSETKQDPHGNLNSIAMTGNVLLNNGNYFGVMLIWSEPSFALFAFDLLAMMNGTYRNGFVSSFHGFPYFG